MIWIGFVADKMRTAVCGETVVDITATPKGAPGPVYLLRAKGSALKFKGFLAVYEEAKEEKRDQKPKAEETSAAGAEEVEPDATSTQLPPLTEGEVLALRKLDTDQHFTQPPPRFSEASLVKDLEENGIGRPSTYASIIATLEPRDYMQTRDPHLYPTDLPFL